MMQAGKWVDKKEVCMERIYGTYICLLTVLSIKKAGRRILRRPVMFLSVKLYGLLECGHEVSKGFLFPCHPFLELL